MRYSKQNPGPNEGRSRGKQEESIDRIGAARA